MCFAKDLSFRLSSAPYLSVDRRMEDLTNMRNTKSTDEKHSFEDSVTPTWFTSAANVTRNFSEKLLAWGVEERDNILWDTATDPGVHLFACYYLIGIRPVAVEERTETHFINIFFLWFSANTNILAFAAGTLGPVTFGLGLRDSCLVILFFNLLCAVPPAYLTTWGPKLGLRQLCASRYTFGYYGAAVPSFFSITSAYIGRPGSCQYREHQLDVRSYGITCQATSNLTDFVSVGIVIISVISLFVSFCGLRVLNWCRRKTFCRHPSSTGHTISSDYTAYFHPRVSSWRVFVYSYIGLTISTVRVGVQLDSQPPLTTYRSLSSASALQAAISAPSIPEWNAGYTDGNVGGLIKAMLSPVGGFGKFLMVLLSLSVTGTNTPTIYSMCMEFQVLIPPLVVSSQIRVFGGRYCSRKRITVLSIVGQHKLYATFSDFLGIIGYWAATWLSATLMEHFYFRKSNFALYDIQFWNVPSRLPLGAAALGSSILSFALVIPSMNQVLYTGPIARKTGDIGFEVAMVVTALLYVPLRHLEKRWRGQRGATRYPTRYVRQDDIPVHAKQNLVPLQTMMRITHGGARAL
ncbi:NCS cytosine-purine permease [Russula emetica]|nr:NCS cytosine-purine permease [Russula emetica]